VTHNANLVIHTDADQIIVAEAGPDRPGELPTSPMPVGGLVRLPVVFHRPRASASQDQIVG
jgi:hypothetical protein